MRSEAPQFGTNVEMPFSSLPVNLSAHEFRAVRHFLVLGKNRDTLVAAAEIYPSGVELEIFTLNKRGKLQITGAVASKGQDTPVGNGRVTYVESNGQSVSLIFRSREPIPEPLVRHGDKPLRLLKRLARRKERWTRKTG